MKRGIFLCILSLLFLVACGGSPTPITEAAPDVTDVPIATNTPQPTEAPAPTNTSQPTEAPSISFVDDFEGSLDPSWDWVNEDPTRWQLTEDGWLEITAANPGFGAGEENNIRMTNALTRPAPQGSFILTTRVYANPDENFQQAGINVFVDGHNYVSILTAFCQPCLPESGSGFLMEAFKDNQYVSGGMVGERDLELTDVYLRLVYDADAKTVTGFARRQPDQWQQIGVIEDFPPVQYISLGAANAPSQEGQQKNLQAAFAYVEISPEDTPVRSNDPLPSMTTPEEPEATLIPETTPLPEGVLFRDDFEGYLQPGWQWINENPENWSFVEFDNASWLKIIAENPGGFAEQKNTLMHPLPEGDFVITAHVIANPQQNFQQANIFIFEDESNFIRLNFGFCDICRLKEGGYGFYMETIIDNNPFGDLIAIPRAADTTDVYLRLVNQGGTITGYYATEYGSWQKIGAFGNYFDFVSVGLGATNSLPPDNEVEALEALFDYFEISLPE